MFSKYLYLWVTLIMNTNMINLLNLGAHGLDQKLIRKARSFNFIEEFARTSVPGVSRRIITDVQDGGHRLVEISQDSSGKVLNCNAFGSKELIDTMLNEVPDNAITTVTEDEMDQFVDLCHNREINATKEAPKSIFNIVGHILQRFVIYPGTKWCGDGTLAKNYDDLGMDREADMCCRDHDHSSDSIGPLQTKHGLANSKPYTMTHCRDDCNLYNCMRNVNSSVSNAVGVIYFDVLKMKCFAYDYPQHCTKQNRTNCDDDCKFYNCLLEVNSLAGNAMGTIFFDTLRTNCFAYGYPDKCVSRNWISIPLLAKSCKEYQPDTSKSRKWQTFPQPSYSGADQPRNCTLYN